MAFFTVKTLVSGISNTLPNIETYLSKFSNKTADEINDLTLGYLFELYKRHEDENTSSFIEERKNLSQYKINWKDSDSIDNVNNDFVSTIETVQNIINYHKTNLVWPKFFY